MLTTMNESAVFGHVINELETREYQPLIHIPRSHQDTYADVLNRCESHQITIGGRYPDVLGFTHADRVFAVEVKGLSGGFGNSTVNASATVRVSIRRASLDASTSE